MVHTYFVNNFYFLNKVQREIMKSEHDTIESDLSIQHNHYQSPNNIFHWTRKKPWNLYENTKVSISENMQNNKYI